MWIIGSGSGLEIAEFFRIRLLHASHHSTIKPLDLKKGFGKIRTRKYSDESDPIKCVWRDSVCKTGVRVRKRYSRTEMIEVG